MLLACPPLLSSIPAVSFDRGLSLTLLCLSCSLCLRIDYGDFRSGLEQSLPLLDGPALPTTDDKSIDAALKVLRMDGDSVDQAGQPRAPVDNVDDALKILVHSATEEFGFAPRDVYEGVFRLPWAKKQQAEAMKSLDYTTLKTLVKAFSESRRIDTLSSRVVTVYPRESLDDHDDWVVEFKSIQIAKKVLELMRSEEDIYLRETYDVLHKIPEGSILVGRIFEAIVHRLFSGGWYQSEVPLPQPVRMFSNRCNPPKFSTKQPSSSSSSSSTTTTTTATTLPPPPMPLRTSARVAIRVNFNDDLREVTLDNNYYTPTAPNHPLFDSFTVDLDENTAVISIFQVTTSANHGGSAQGYRDIRKIMTRVCELLGQVRPNAIVKVVYFLVCPENGPQHHVWQMPVEWDLGIQTHDHRGDAFCIRVPVSVLHGTSC
jgi:hypothetical protein